MAAICKRFRFEAAHQLPNHKGKCANLHGHSYRVDVTIRGNIQDPTTAESDAGFVTDFGDVSEVMKPMIEKYFDHKFLNESIGVPRTTAEMIAVWVFKYIFMSAPHLPVIGVEVWETEDSYAAVTYSDYEQWGELCLLAPPPND